MENVVKKCFSKKIGGNKVIQVKNVTKKYGKFTAVDNISFTVEDGEVVGYMTILIMVIAESEEELQRRCKKIENKIMGMQMKVRNLANLVRNAFKSITPFNILDDKIRKIANRNVPLSTFVGGLPFASNGFNDNDGYYFARDTEGRYCCS